MNGLSLTVEPVTIKYNGRFWRADVRRWNREAARSESVWKGAARRTCEEAEADGQRFIAAQEANRGQA